MTFVKICPVLKDNYTYLLCESALKRALVVDPVVPKDVISRIMELGPDWKLDGIINTHHHWDHSGGNLELVQTFPNLKVYGGDSRIPSLTVQVKDKVPFDFGSFKITPLATPCHTSGSFSFLVESESSSPLVFTGDTLFKAGCGRFFEGTPLEMYNALVKNLGKLSPETQVYPGHEYTRDNLKFAKSVDPENDWIDKCLAECEESKVTIPSTIELEWKINPFMRAELLKESLNATDGVHAMQLLREKKNAF